jgi:two-component system sensor histidine kinase YesM
MSKPSRILRMKHTIQLRLTAYILAVILPLAIFNLLVINQSVVIVREQTEDRVRQALDAALRYVEVVMTTINDLNTQYAADPAVQSLQVRGEDGWNPAQLLEWQQLLNGLTKVSSFNRFLDELAFYHGESGLFVSSNFGSAVLEREERRMSWYESWHQQIRGAMVYVPSPSAAANRQAATLLPIDDPGKVAIMMSVPGALSEDKPNLIISFIKKDQVVVSQGPEAAGRLFVVNQTSAQSEWSVQFEQPSAELYRSLDTLRSLTWVLLGIGIVTALYGSYLVYRSITTPLSRLAMAMKQFELGNWETKIRKRRYDEIGSLYESFNRMAEEHQVLIRDKYEQRLKLLRAELKLLHSQINPHFLYNTLESIYSSTFEYEARKTGDMILHLSRFFRFSLGKGREAFTLADTFQHIGHYLRIQQLRFMDKFAVVTYIQPGTESYPILKLLLQPIVENAVVHGVERLEQDGRLEISSRADEDHVYIEVRDNGPGMPEERLQEVRAHLATVTAEEIASGRFVDVAEARYFSLGNVKSRMLLYYGRESELTVESVPGQGVTVRLIFPKRPERQMSEPQ